MSNHGTILIAEDEPALGQIVKESLESREFKVRLAEDGEKAMEFFQEIRPEVVVLDVMVPRKDGFTVAREIRKQDKNIPIIFLTAKSQVGDVLEGFGAGCNDYLKKPFSVEELIVRIENLISRKKDLTPAAHDKGTGIFPIRQGNKTILLETSKITYILASGYYAEIYTKSKKLVIRESLTNLMEMLDHQNFVRVHRSAIINIKHIQEIVHSDYSELDVKMKDNKLISISKSQKKDFLGRIGM